jgi:hypothetical protein
VTLERPEFGESADGQPVWTAKAARARYQTDAKVADLEAVEAGFYEGGKLVTRAKAPGAVWREVNRELALIGGATLQATTGRAGVEARAARWDAAAGRLHADGGVRFWQGANSLSAEALQADRALRRVELTGGVVGRFVLGPGTYVGLARSGGKVQ